MNLFLSSCALLVIGVAYGGKSFAQLSASISKKNKSVVITSNILQIQYSPTSYINLEIQPPNQKN